MKTKLFLLTALFVSLPAPASADCATARFDGESCAFVLGEFKFDCSEIKGAKPAPVKCSNDRVAMEYSSETHRYTAAAVKKGAEWVLEKPVERVSLSKKTAAADKPVATENKKKSTKRKPAAAPPEEFPLPELPVVTTPLPPPPAPAAPAPATPSAPAAPVVPAPTTTAAPAFEPTWKIGALIQMWYAEVDPEKTDASSTFRPRRAEVRVSGSQMKDTRWFASFDLAKKGATKNTTVVTGVSPTKTTTVTGVNTDGDQKIMQDLGIGFTLLPGLELLLGQVKTQSPSESHESSADLILAERSIVSRTYGERREPGAVLVYKKETYNVAAMVSNGEGPNVEDTKHTKDFSARAEAKPLQWLSLGAFCQAKNLTFGNLAATGTNVGFSYGPLALRAEQVWGNDFTTHSDGQVADLSYKISPKWQALVRYETLRPNTNAVGRAEMTSLGANYFFSGKALKLQMNVSEFRDMNGSTGTMSYQKGTNGWMSLISIQSSF